MREREYRLDEDDRRPARRKRSREGRGLVRLLVGVIALLLVVGAGLGISLLTGAISTAQPTAATAVPIPTPRATTAEAGATGTAGAATQGDAAPKVIVTKKATYGDWIYTCAKRQESDPVRCAIAQQLSDAKTNSPLLLWRIAQGDKGLVGEWQTRRGVMAAHGILLDAGTKKPITIPYQFCTATGCQAVAQLAPDFVEALAKTQKATATIYPIGAKGIVFTFSVKGLPDALAALKQP